jgi:hypothetical protein
MRAVVHRPVTQVRLQHRAVQVGKQRQRRLLVVPHMRAGAEAAARVGVAALKAAESTVLQSEDGRAAQHRQAVQRGFGNRRGMAGNDALHEAGSALPQVGQARDDILRHAPRVLEAQGVVVAHDGVALAVPPAHLAHVAVREVPAQQEAHARGLVGRKRQRYGDRRFPAAFVAGRAGLARRSVGDGRVLQQPVGQRHQRGGQVPASERPAARGDGAVGVGQQRERAPARRTLLGRLAEQQPAPAVRPRELRDIALLVAHDTVVADEVA